VGSGTEVRSAAAVDASGHAAQRAVGGAREAWDVAEVAEHSPQIWKWLSGVGTRPTFSVLNPESWTRNNSDHPRSKPSILDPYPSSLNNKL